MYEKITSTNEAKFIKILYNTLPDHIKNRMQRFSDNLFTKNKELILKNQLFHQNILILKN